MNRAVMAVMLTMSIGGARAETESELNRAIREIENIELGGSYKVNPGAFACADKGKLMFVERLAGGDSVDQDNAQLIGARDCEVTDEDTVYTRCEAGGFVFPQRGGQHIFSGYCVHGTKAPVLYIRDDEVRKVRN
ncbi:MAG: hypothetical protein K2Y42_06185 [Hyphomicrobium sp.]|jgi:hypothetical protein|uniref:hypothetical protein n=1 Tax=Hyphomicrobium sp. TaxID=82 RepID=UPI0025BEAB06|nr:hypothetical protein [Hyphomicrobium sp.]MBX9862325.1 hypothetical protein [Hyphomicrobium sp.]